MHDARHERRAVFHGAPDQVSAGVGRGMYVIAFYLIFILEATRRWVRWCTPRTQEAEAGEWQVRSQPVLHSETLFQSKQIKQENIWEKGAIKTYILFTKLL